MKRLFKYLSSYKKDCIIGSTFKLIEVIFELIVPLVVASVINVGIVGNDEAHIGKMAVALFLLGVFGLFFSITAQYFSANAATGFAAKVRTAIFKKVESLSFTRLDDLGTSAILTRITSDVNLVQNGVNLGLRLLLRSPVVVFGAMIMAFTVDVKSALIFVVVIPVLFIIVFILLWAGIKLYKIVQKKLDIALNEYRENLKGIKVLRAFCKEENEKELFDKANKDFEKWQLISGRIMATMNPVTLLIVNLGIIALLKSGAVSVSSGRLLSGDVVALINYMSQILVELLKFANLIITLSKSMAGASRIADFLDIPEDKKLSNDNSVSETNKIYEVKDMTFNYQGSDEPVLSNITFDVIEGETIGIIGGTGSGKSTLVNILCGFYPVTEGKVYYKGKDIATYSKEDMTNDTAIVMQKSVLFSGTIESNLKWGKADASKEDMVNALNAAQADFALEKGLDTVVEQEGKNFSGGQRQRLSIARALIKNPLVLVLDDSASALDYVTEYNLNKALSQIRDNKTTFIISQRVSSVLSADKILVLEDGHLVGLGTHKELIETCEVYKEIYYAQFPENEEGNSNEK